MAVETDIEEHVRPCGQTITETDREPSLNRYGVLARSLTGRGRSSSTADVRIPNDCN
jgi:hypothetical protein